MKKISVKWIAQSAIIAALYAALTWLLAPISYGSIQFRVSEILMLLVVFKPSYAAALILGCFVANTTSSLGWWDMVFGTLATIVAVLPMMKIKRLWVAALLPVVSNGIIVSIELYLALGIAPIWLSIITVALGEAVVLFLIGIPVMIAISKNTALVELLDLDVANVKTSNFLTIANALAIAMGILGIVIFIAYPFFSVSEVIDGESVITLYSPITMFKDNWWVVFFIILSIAYTIGFLFSKKILKLILSIIIALLFLILFILIGFNYNEALTYPYYYGFIIFIILLILLGYYGYKKDKEVI